MSVERLYSLLIRILLFFGEKDERRLKVDKRIRCTTKQRVEKWDKRIRSGKPKTIDWSKLVEVLNSQKRIRSG